MITIFTNSVESLKDSSHVHSAPMLMRVKINSEYRQNFLLNSGLRKLKGKKKA